jgi:hypothetical protein
VACIEQHRQHVIALLRALAALRDLREDQLVRLLAQAPEMRKRAGFLE